MAYNLVIDDPYIKEKIQDLNKMIHKINVKELQKSVAQETPIQSFELDDIKLTSNYPIHVVVNQVKTNLQTFRRAEDISYLKRAEKDSTNLPQFPWCQSVVKNDINIIQKKYKTKMDLMDLKEKATSADSLTVEELIQLSRKFIRLESTIKRESSLKVDEELISLLDNVKQEIENKQNKMLQNNPISELKDIINKLEVNKDNPEETLQLQDRFNNIILRNKEIISINLDKKERKEINLQISKLQKKSDAATDHLLWNLQNYNNEQILSIIEFLDFKGFDDIYDKNGFIQYIHDNLIQEPKNTNEIKINIQNQVILHLIQNAASQIEFTRAVSMVQHPKLRGLHPDNRKKAAELFYADNVGQLQAYSSIESFITEGLYPYIESIKTFGSKINYASSKEQLSNHLREYNEKWFEFNEDDLQQIAKRVFLKKSIIPYQSIKRLEQDIEKAVKNDLLTWTQLKKYIYTCENNAVFTLHYQEKSNSTKSPGVYVLDKENEYSDTLSIVIV